MDIIYSETRGLKMTDDLGFFLLLVGPPFIAIVCAAAFLHYRFSRDDHKEVIIQKKS